MLQGRRANKIVAREPRGANKKVAKKTRRDRGCANKIVADRISGIQGGANKIVADRGGGGTNKIVANGDGSDHCRACPEKLMPDQDDSHCIGTPPFQRRLPV